MAISAQGIKFYWQASTTAPTTSSTLVRLTGITNVSGPGGAAAVIDVSNFDSTAKEKLMGLPDEGQVTLTVNWDTPDATLVQRVMIADRKSRTKRAWGICFPDPTSSLATGEGYCTGFSVSGSVDAKVEANITVEITGPLTWTSGT